MVLEWRRKKARLPVPLDDELLLQLADESEAMLMDAGSRRGALQECLDNLPADQRNLIDKHYFEGETLSEIARIWKCRRASLYDLLRAALSGLERCIEGRMFAQKSS